MNLYIIRHGDAESISAGKKDFERNLTSQGIEQIKNAATQWKKFIDHFDSIISSPYVRAVQTAKTIAQIFNYEKELIIDDALSAGSITKNIIELVNSNGGDDIALIGHEPDCSNHVSNLISSADINIHFSKAAIVKISFPTRANFAKGTLEYLLPPKILKH